MAISSIGCLIGAVLLSTLFALPASQAQTPAALTISSPQPPLNWETIAIHPLKAGEGENDFGGNVLPDGTRIHAMTLLDVVSMAYNFSIGPLRDDEISGLPAWGHSERFDVVARVSPEDAAAFQKISHPPTKEMIHDFAERRPTGEMLMMRSLLAERFHLQAHYEERERTVYTMVVDRSGPKLKTAADPAKGGTLMIGEGKITGKDAPAPFIAILLGFAAGRTVLDRTGLTGEYDLDLKFKPQDAAAAADSTDPDLFTAVREQLGLRLETTRARVQTLMIDHVEQPTPN